MDNPKPILRTTDLSVSAGAKTLLNPVSLDIPECGVFGIIGPSGAGKSTFLRSLNRLAELSPGLRISGQVYLHGQPIYGSKTNSDQLRSRIGILFQQPVVFPCSILANVLFGVRHLGIVPKREWPETAERALRQAALWDEVKDRLKKPGQQLSVGQQQRLCLARTLATGTDILLMDATSALDPKSTEAIEDLILTLHQSHTIALVTHNMRQAERLCKTVAFIGLGSDGVGTMLAHGNLADLQSRTDITELEDYLCCELPETSMKVAAEP